jgi:hypothetical protein
VTTTTHAANPRRLSRHRDDTVDALLAAVAVHPGASAADLAAVTGIGRSTATKALAALAVEGKVVRRAGGLDAGHRLADRWSLPAGCFPNGNGRLRKGELAAMVLAYVRAAPGQHSPVSVAKALGGKSPGAVANVLDKFVGTGDVVEVCAVPRRYEAVTR